MLIRETFLPFALPSIGEAEIAEVVDTLRSGWLTTGPKTHRFEQEFAAYVGSRHPLAATPAPPGSPRPLAPLGLGRIATVLPGRPTFTPPAEGAGNSNPG